jgi:hypothetical protein
MRFTAPFPWKQQRRGPDGFGETRFSRAAVIRRSPWDARCARKARRVPAIGSAAKPSSQEALPGRSRRYSPNGSGRRVLPGVVKQDGYGLAVSTFIAVMASLKAVPPLHVFSSVPAALR